MKTSTARRTLPRKFRELSDLHPLRPLHDRVDLENAQEIVDALAVLAKRTRDQDDYLESLSLLIEHFENAHTSIAPGARPPVEALRYLIEGHQMSESDLGRLLGERSLGNAILSGRRALSKSHIRTLADRFKVSADLFI